LKNLSLLLLEVWDLLVNDKIPNYGICMKVYLSFCSTVTGKKFLTPSKKFKINNFD